mmetsp:Transcript_23581/g.3899  ORF Transcript_23581/g.3899 Transcript_23581/m.3899 type:complete len:131 (+) Transcript_23581:5122-5514(+)
MKTPVWPSALMALWRLTVYAPKHVVRDVKLAILLIFKPAWNVKQGIFSTNPNAMQFAQTAHTRRVHHVKPVIPVVEPAADLRTQTVQVATRIFIYTKTNALLSVLLVLLYSKGLVLKDAKSLALNVLPGL